MSKGEILTWTWDDISLNKNPVTVKHTISRNKKTKTIPMISKIRTILLELKPRSDSGDQVFTFDGKPIRDIRRAFEKSCKRAKIIGLRFHVLRHTAATRMVDSGVNIVTVSKILGHSDY